MQNWELKITLNRQLEMGVYVKTVVIRVEKSFKFPRQKETFIIIVGPLLMGRLTY
jgi:rRNA pseudouridine-1189 N-methylase Emg1 (Nep1/Mra1 family)